MALIHSLEESGLKLFKLRGQLPVVLFILAVPFIYVTNYANFSQNELTFYTALSIVLCVLGLLVRAITIGTTPAGTSGRNRDEQVAEQLNTRGIYSMVRHPLYLGNYLMWIGIVMYTYNWYFVIIVSLMYWLYYERIMFAEERFLERKFGSVYLEWSREVPAFLPAFGNYQPGKVPFSLKTVLRREYSGVLATVVGFVFVDFVRIYFTEDTFRLYEEQIIALVVAGALAVVLKLLKKFTRILHEEDRS